MVNYKNYDPRNHYAFHGDLTNDKAYWLGVIASDGCLHLHKRDNTFCICLALTDKELVEKFSLFIGAKKPRLCKNNGVDKLKWQTQMYSDIMGIKLLDYGITTEKSHTLKVSQSLVENKNFWRGIFDGDGCIYFDVCYQRWSVSFGSSSQEFINQFYSFYPHYYKSKRKDKNFWDIKIKHGNFERYFLQMIYHDSTPETRLDRKHRLALKVIYNV